MPSGNQAKAVHGTAMWVSLEIMLDVGGQITHYAIEGHPDEGGARVKFDPEFDDGGGPLGMLQAITIALESRLTECTLNITNEPIEPSRPAAAAPARLRLVEP